MYAYMSEQRKKYKEKYLEYYNCYGEDIPLDFRLQLKEYRQSLGLTTTEVDDIIEKVKNPGLEVRRIISDGNPTVDISAVKDDASMLGEQYADLVDNLAEFENYVQNVLDMTSQLSDRCKVVTKNLADVGTTLAKIGYKRMNKQKSGGSATFGVGLAIAAAAEIYDQYKKRQIQQQEERRLQTLLDKKQAYANVSYDTMSMVFDQSQKTLSKYDELFTDQSTNFIEWKDNLRDKKFKMFEFAFFCKIKFQYLVELLAFTLQEMEAWMNGYQNSDAPYPSLKSLIDDEIYVWASFLSGTEDFDENKWTEYLDELITKNKDSYWPIEYMLLTKPYFLRNYVGVALWDTNPTRLYFRYRAATPIITILADEARDRIGMLTHEKQQICSNVKEMLSNNAYFNECKQLVASNIKSPAKFGFMDVCVLIIMFFISWFGTFCLMALLAGIVEGGGNVGFVISILLIVGLAYLMYRKRENILHLMPCIRKNDSYFRMLDDDLRYKEKEIANKYNDIKL